MPGPRTPLPRRGSHLIAWAPACIQSQDNAGGQSYHLHCLAESQPDRASSDMQKGGTMKQSEDLKRPSLTVLLGVVATLLGGGGLGVIVNQYMLREKTAAEARLLIAQADEAKARTSQYVSRLTAPSSTSHDDGPIKGWFKAGSNPQDYEIGTDRTDLFRGMPTGYIKSRDSARGFGTIMQMFLADSYVGKRIKLTASAKSEGVEGWAGFWLRVDGPEKALSFDNMQDRAIKGTTGWTKYQIVLDAPADSVYIALGLLLNGPGKVWMADAGLEVVAANEAITSTVVAYPDKPINLKFTE